MMYSDLFSSLDGMRSMVIWVYPLLSSMILWSSSSWLSSARAASWNILYMIWQDKKLTRFPFFRLMVGSLFFFLLINNLLGLTPYNYTFTSNLFLVSSIAMLFWMMLMLSGCMYNIMKTVAHLAPAGAPMLLLPFLVLIETISILIRPLTLTVRMIANISAGHIVLGLMANASTAFMSSLFILALPFGMLAYTMFEFFVSMIQAYIFTLLITLYSDEHPCSYSLIKTKSV
uniref:ATP synthase subunit a n=1 Tax=Aegista aubryana TaxID=1789663 RepID=A0A0Y0KH10_9EUPU|nr:ATP synthase F0 subunit 6 [Aegista aubryana]AMB49889.1 ATP synthase F0 subunit 6 [Aegista aubryana]